MERKEFPPALVYDPVNNNMREVLRNGKISAPSKRWWLITLNNPSSDWKADFQALGSQWGIGQLEQGENGTPHVQGVLWFAEKLKNTYWKGKSCWSRALPTEDVERSIAYCTKNETRQDGPYQFGKDPRKSSGHKQRVARNYNAALDLLKEGRLKEVEADVLIPHFGNCQKLQSLFQVGSRHSAPRGIWIYGSPGMGKSYYVRERFPDCYSKPQNKWWDGYSREKSVLLDDLDQHGACLSHLLKIWLDEYPFSGEIKGGTVMPSYDHFVITSNYLPTELWDDAHTVEAIQRRCVFIHFYGYCQMVEGTHFGVLPRVELPPGPSPSNYGYLLQDFLNQ